MVADLPVLVLMPGNVDFLGINSTPDSDPPLVSQVSTHKWESLCVGPSKEHLVFQSLSVSPRQPKSTLVFTVRIFGISFSLAGPLVEGLPNDPPLQPLSPSQWSLPPMDASPARFATLLLPLTTMWLLYITRQTCYNQLDFIWLSTLIILWFDCNFNADLRGGDSCFYLVKHFPPFSPIIFLLSIRFLFVCYVFQFCIFVLWLPLGLQQKKYIQTIGLFLLIVSYIHSPV